MNVKITADSTCDLSPELVEKYGIHIIPLCVVKGGETLLDGVSITPRDIFRYFDETGELCKTSALNAARYTEHFTKFNRSFDAVVHIGISSGFSSTVNAARMAAAELGNVYVVDSRNLSSGSGHVVLDAAELAACGADAHTIVDHLTDLVPRVEASFVIDTLKYLRKGGRCSSIAALGANLLNIKPSIEVVNGGMVVGKKYRGTFEKAVLAYVDDRLTGRDDIDYSRLFITHPDCPPELVASVKAEVMKLAHFDEIIETRAGCCVSAHCGPRTIGILFKRKRA